ncbi:hypothetical protein PC9H_010070 [Pleurotus ostreatus]|uniref:F-box domain-containing protein n=1 Tax=Pleurotus ostreatus TaxID=5322 RepID=A0A8H6ZQU6_PLEOS|nr:uncharacterized protein PC9H_010070 [Pleurotus ostreatus]KAF7424759.1 hypothetical protein PC9H_010070 [Pleurotus ostreatus]KAJ8692238.1 hypothetical protein PTI98_009569 [Pleurotus ostreatus]
MLTLLKLPPKLLLNVAGYLTKPSDCLALSLTCCKLQVTGEQQLYSNVTLRSKHDAAADNWVEMLYHCLTLFEPRCEWVHSLSVTLVHPPTPRELERLTAIMHLLSCLDNLKLEYSSTARNLKLEYSSTARNVKAIDLRPLLKVCSMSPESSLRRFVWRNLDTLNETFVSFLCFHRSLQHLEFNFEIPKIGIKILPNIEVLRMPIATVLQLLPGRQIQCVKTAISDNTPLTWMGMSFLDMEKIQIFSSTVFGGDEGVEIHESLVQQLGCLEFLEILLRATLMGAQDTRTHGTTVPCRGAEGNEGSKDIQAWLQLLAAPPTLLRALYFQRESYAGTEGMGGGEGMRWGDLNREARVQVRKGTNIQTKQ